MHQGRFALRYRMTQNRRKFRGLKRGGCIGLVQKTDDWPDRKPHNIKPIATNIGKKIWRFFKVIAPG